MFLEEVQPTEEQLIVSIKWKHLSVKKLKFNFTTLLKKQNFLAKYNVCGLHSMQTQYLEWGWGVEFFIFIFLEGPSMLF